LIDKYEWLVRWRRQLRKLAKDGYDYNMDRRKILEEIIRQVDSLPIYGEICGKLARPLGLRKSAELAILAIELPPHLPMVKLKTLLRLVPGGNRGRYGTTIG